MTFRQVSEFLMFPTADPETIQPCGQSALSGQAPVMLAKSELATTASYKQKVKCSVERFDQIWALLTGLRKERWIATV